MNAWLCGNAEAGLGYKPEARLRAREIPVITAPEMLRNARQLRVEGFGLRIAEPLLAPTTALSEVYLQTLLVVDDDLAFVFWLGFGLDARGLETIPAKNATAARALLGRIEYPLKVAIVNAALPGTARLVKDLRRHQPRQPWCAIV